MATLEIRLLGEFSMFYEGAPLNGLNGARAQCLLAYLLLHRDAPVARAAPGFPLLAGLSRDAGADQPAQLAAHADAEPARRGTLHPGRGPDRAVALRCPVQS